MSEISKISVNGVGYDVCDESARSRCDSLGKDVARNMTEISAINTDLGLCQGNIKFIKDDVDDINAKVGTEELSTTSQTLIGAINEVKGSVGESGGDGDYMTISNPYCEGSLSMNRWGPEQGFAIGENSVALGLNARATHKQSVSLGENCNAQADNCLSGGNNSTVQGYGSMAFGNTVQVYGANALGTGYYNTIHTNASGSAIHGSNNNLYGSNSLCIGRNNSSYGNNAFIQGQYCVTDTSGKYAHIVGNGQYVAGSGNQYSNAYTLDWSGNGWFAGDVTIHDTDGSEYSLLDIVKRLVALEQNV